MSRGNLPPGPDGRNNQAGPRRSDQRARQPAYPEPAYPEPAYEDHAYPEPDYPEEVPPTRSGIPWKALAGICAGLVLVVLGIAVIAPKQFRHQFDLSFVRQPTPYTQLYFDNPGTLPVTAAVNKSNTFAFTVVNNEGKVYQYSYVVTLADSHAHLVVAKEDVTIGNGASVTRKITVKPKDRKSDYLITITLKGMNQAIQFYEKTP